MTELTLVGLMSGTSVDGIDAVLTRQSDTGVELLATHQHPLPSALAADIQAISHSGADEIERLGRLDRKLGHCFADAVMALLEVAGIDAADVHAIGSHGQTVRHRPPGQDIKDESAFTLQVGDANTIAERTGIATVADFRRRDIAAGGQGAPLVPPFHAAAFGTAGVTRAIVNIGGIANATLLDGTAVQSGFDTGPGNTLLDQWISQHRGAGFDADGAWAAEGKVQEALLQRLSSHIFFQATGPRSTGKEAFNLEWLNGQLAGEPVTTIDVQATLAQLTANTIAAGIRGSGCAVKDVFVCGGGAHNIDLMRRLHLALPEMSLDTTARLGIGVDWVEAAAFAWLAGRSLQGLAGNCPVVTGARGERVLGTIYPA